MIQSSMHLFCGRDAVALPTAKPGHTLARPGHCLVQERSDVEPEFDRISDMTNVY